MVDLSYLQERFYEEENCYVDVLYQTGRLHIYHQWLEKLKKEHQLFLNAACFPDHFSKFILEVSEDENYSVSSLLDQSRYVLEARRSDLCYTLNRNIPLDKRLNYHLISNGTYQEVSDLLPQVLDRGSFTIGVCLPKKDKRYKQESRQYKILYDRLLKEKIQGLSCQEIKKNDYAICLVKGGRL